MYIIIEGLKFSPALQRHNTENLNQIFPEKELRSLLSPNFHIHVSVSDLYIFPQSVCLFGYRKIWWTDPGIYKSLTDTRMWELGQRAGAIPLLGIQKCDFRCSAAFLFIFRTNTNLGQRLWDPTVVVGAAWVTSADRT